MVYQDIKGMSEKHMGPAFQFRMQKLSAEPREQINDSRRSELTRAGEHVLDVSVVFSLGLC